MSERIRVNIARVCYTVVFISNMYCALAFIFNPDPYVGSYELSAASGGIAAIQGMGVVFAMWNVTYPFYIVNPLKQKTLGIVIIVQQIVGLVGELFIKTGLDKKQSVLEESIMRFVWFDFAGLILLIIGFAIVYKLYTKTDTPSPMWRDR